MSSVIDTLLEFFCFVFNNFIAKRLLMIIFKVQQLVDSLVSMMMNSKDGTE